MRFPKSAALIALLVPLAIVSSGLSGAHAQEMKYKAKDPPAEKQARDKRPPAEQPQGKPRPPEDRQRPPDKERPDKGRPKPPPPPPVQPPPAPRPPAPDPYPHGWPVDPPCPPRPYPQPYPHPHPTPPIIGDPWCPPVIEPLPIPGPVDLETALARSMRRMNIEGFVGQVVVGIDGQIRFEKNYAGAGYYDTGTVTKAFTAWAVYRLVDDRKLAFNTTLGKLFPGAPYDKRGITIEQLLEQTSGLGSSYAADGETDRTQAVTNLLAQPLAHAPGAAFTESDDSYVILAAAIEVASGMAYESYLLESDAVSRDMTSTVFWGERGFGRQQANWGKRGAEGVLSTAHDLYIWASRFVDHPDEMTNEIMRPRTWTEDGVGIGCGWFSTDPDSDDPLRWTSGIGDSDHNVMVMVYPSNAILVVTSDRFHYDIPWSERVANALEPLLREWRPVEFRLDSAMR